MIKFQWTRKPDFKNILLIDYDEYWKGRGFVLNKKLKEREEIIFSGIDKGSRVLDIGCGNSLFPVKLKEKGCSVCVGDISEVVLKNFEKLGIDNTKIDLDKISSFKINKNFDYIVLSEVLEHTRNPEEVVNILKRSTKNFIITIPNSAYYRFRLSLLFRGRFFTQWVSHPSEHLRFWSHIDFLDWLSDLGLGITKVEASNGLDIGPLKLFKYFPNLFGFQMCYFVKVK